MIRVPERYRVRSGELASCFLDGNNGLFRIGQMTIIASDGEGWEHVSVSFVNRCPTWEEMCAVKNVFWPVEDAVVQFHPAKADYVNHHPYCLHMWRPTDGGFPVPPAWMVGPKA